MSEETTPRVLPVLPLPAAVIFPGQVVPLLVGRPVSIAVVEEAVKQDRTIGLFTQRDASVEEPQAANLHTAGCSAHVLKLLKHPEDHVTVLVRGMHRVRLVRPAGEGPGIRVEVEPIVDTENEGISVRALHRHLAAQIQRMFSLMPLIPEEMKAAYLSVEEPARLADMVASQLELKLEEKLEVLGTPSVRERLEKITSIVEREIEVLELGSKIQKDVQQQMDSRAREHFLREQLKAIRRELGEDDEGPMGQELKDLQEKLEGAGMPEAVLEEARKELKRLGQMQPASPEFTVARTYLDWIAALPWAKEAEERLDIPEARRVLDEDHFDIEQVKERILEHLAVRKRNPAKKGPILCFVGPPGTGKTSLVKSIARALNRPYQRMALGGMRDEAEIRGHRRTYVGALPGRILQTIRKTGVRNPVLCLDEVDKLGTDYRGDPASALLEVLDPEQNDSFTDHYLAVPFDLSHVLFVTTANVPETIPGPLRDRMEMIQLPGYTPEDKVRIAHQYLLPRQKKDAGIAEEELAVSDEALATIAFSYTHEAGVRNLERQIGSVCRKVARALSEGTKPPIHVTPENLEDYLGTPKHYAEMAERTALVGVAVGLAWTAAGGDILFIEATKMPGRGLLILTGQLGEVMKESAHAALSYLRSRAEQYGIPKDLVETHDIHVHVPAGAIPKDGPSAGVSISSALASLMLGRPCRADTAMTGEITLRGKVLPVGGIKEKVLAARRAGITSVILPARNKGDADEIPRENVEGMTLRFVETLDEVLDAALMPALT